MKNALQVIVPMAGRGSRFQSLAASKREYAVPKPLISVFGRPMVRWAIDSLTSFHLSPRQLTFVILKEHECEYAMTKKLQGEFGQDIQVVVIETVTRGAVETAAAARHLLDSTSPLLISDSDHYFDGAALFRLIQENPHIDGAIAVFKPPDDDPKWSYTLFDTSYTAISVAEKDPILAKKGAYANIGAYYFSKAKYFFDIAQETITSNDMSGPLGKQEFFVAPLYHKLIQNGCIIKAAITPNVWGLGTPTDLEYFLTHYK